MLAWGGIFPRPGTGVNRVFAAGSGPGYDGRMRHRRGIPLLLLLLALLGSPWPVAHAAPPPETARAAPAAAEAAGPIRVQVGTYLLSIGKLDISANSYYIDLYLSLRCDRPCDPGTFEVMNGRSYTVDKQDDEPTYKVFRVKGELTSSMNLRPFPFDSHQLLVTLEDKLLPESGLVYAADLPRTGMHGDLLLAGWRVTPGSITAQVRPDRYPTFGQTYSRYTFSVTLERPWLSAFLKGLLPALLIVISGLLALQMGPDKIMQRLTVCTSALVASALFHINLTASIPPIGYLTFADRLMLINYVILLVALGASILLMNLIDAHREPRAVALHRRIKWLTPLGWGLLQAGNALIGW